MLKHEEIRRDFGKREEWLDLYRKLGHKALDRLKALPEKERPDIKLLEGYFDNETSFDKPEVIEEVSGRWRELTFFKTIPFVVRKGLEFNKNIYIL
jgi:hypothetical protein